MHHLVKAFTWSTLCSQTGSATWLTVVLTHLQVKKYQLTEKSSHIMLQV